MKTLISKSLLTAALAGTISLFSTSTMAAGIYPEFTVDASAYSGAVNAIVIGADKMVGGYQEKITLRGDGSFSASILWQASAYYSNDGNTPFAQTGLANDYGLWARFQGNGTWAPVVGGLQLTLDPNSLTDLGLQLYIDTFTPITTWTAPVDGTGFYTTTGATGSDDLLVATGFALNGQGTSNNACQGGINCGSFGQRSSFALESPDGTDFFVSPDPFFPISFQSGQFNLVIGTPPVGDEIQTINTEGSLDVVFAQVPEPASLALLGIGLFGLGFSKRNRKST